MTTARADRTEPTHAHAASPVSMHVQRAFAQGRARYGDLPLAFDRFAASVVALTRRRLLASGIAPEHDGLEQALSQLAGADLFLTIACEEGVLGAWQTFHDHVGDRLRAVAVRRGASAAEADEIARELPGELCMAPPDGRTRTRLGTFDGAGSLLAWLGVVVRRRLADRRRAPDARAATFADGAQAPAVQATKTPADDPLASVSDSETRAVLEQGLRAAWEGMTARERIAVDLRFRRGMAQTQIARVLAVGEPRVSRILDAAIDKLRHEVGRRLDLAPRRQWDLDRLWQAVARVLDEKGRAHRQEPARPSDPGGVDTHA